MSILQLVERRTPAASLIRSDLRCAVAYQCSPLCDFIEQMITKENISVNPRGLMRNGERVLDTELDATEFGDGDQVIFVPLLKGS